MKLPRKPTKMSKFMGFCRRYGICFVGEALVPCNVGGATFLPLNLKTTTSLIIHHRRRISMNKVHEIITPGIYTNAK
jgi:hypothetical protein